jgi:hypothetical protein
LFWYKFCKVEKSAGYPEDGQFLAGKSWLFELMRIFFDNELSSEPTIYIKSSTCNVTALEHIP